MRNSRQTPRRPTNENELGTETGERQGSGFADSRGGAGNHADSAVEAGQAGFRRRHQMIPVRLTLPRVTHPRGKTRETSLASRTAMSAPSVDASASTFS